MLKAMPVTTTLPTTSVIITIDGPAGTGKSSVAHLLAERLGLEFLDTGAMYRTAALIALERDIDPADGTTLSHLVEQMTPHFDWNQKPPPIMIGERDVSEHIRSLPVNAIVSIVAAQPEIRRVLVDRQRAVAAQHPRLVTEGRDQGSVVFPDAPLRFYLDADVRIRARRRADQLRKTGVPVEEEKMIRDIQSRDEIDSTRPDGPLMRPPGAIVIDTTELSLEEVVDRMERVVRDSLPDAGLKS